MQFERDGLHLYFELHGPEDGRPILLVHGFASYYRLNWVGTRWQETLTNAGFRIIGLDLRGHGSSDKPHDANAYAGETLAADVRGLLDHLRLDRVDYLGFSMGARVGLQAVLDFGERFRKVVLGGIGTRGATADGAAIARALRGGAPENPVAESFHRFAAARPHNDLEALAACIQGPWPRLEPARLAAIKTPLLVAIGERDELVSGAEELVEQIPAARLVVVPGRDHLGTVAAPEFKAAALAFLDEP